MKLLNFVNREQELEVLEKRLASKKPELIIIYGRRRIGKTELIKQFIGGKNAFYFLAEKQDLMLEASRFREKFAKRFDTWLTDTRDFEIIFEDIGKFIGKSGNRMVIVIDEFPYWIEKDKDIVSKFQYIWDEILSKYSIMLIICGSSIGMMETDVLNYRSPLYGRRTSQLKITPLRFKHIKGFLNYGFEDLVKVYAVTGGIPAYINKFQPSLTFEENITKEFFSSDGFLFSESRTLLLEELRDVNTYFNILLAIAEGSTKLGEIAGKAYVDITNINKYLNVLINLGLLEKAQPILGKKSDRVYRIKDNYFHFWVKFVYPFDGDIEIGDKNQLMENFSKNFNSFLGQVFESISAEFLREYKELLPFTFEKIGKWWHRGEEIDILALNEKTKEIAFFECKWKDLSHKEAEKLLSELREKSKLIDWHNKERKEYYGIIARNIKEKGKLRRRGFLAFDLKDLET